MRPQISLRKSLTVTLIGSAFCLLQTPIAAMASESDLVKKLDELEVQLSALKAQLAQPPDTKASAAASKTEKPPALSQTDGITIYGRLDVAAESSNDGAVARTAMQNISSRIGFKASRKFTDDLSGLMQIETGVAPDDNANSGSLASRNSYVGLKSQRYGSFIAGRYDMPFKKLEGVSAPMWGSADAMEIIIHGKGTRVAANVTASPWANLHTRQPNVFQYWSPKFANMDVKVAYSPDEVNGAAGTWRKPVYGLAFEFDNGIWNAGVATETQENAIALNKSMTGVKATAGMKFSAGSVGLAFSKLDNGMGKKTNNWMIAGTYPVGPVLLKANYGESSETNSGANNGLSMLGLEMDYPLDKNTTLYTYYTSISNAEKAQGRFEAADTKYSPAAGNDPSAFGIGIRYDF